MNKGVLKVSQERPRVDLLLALPAPSRFHRVIPIIGMVGIDRLYLTTASKVDKGYFSSHMLQKKDRLNDALSIGLEQSGTSVCMPRVSVHRKLKSLLAQLEEENATTDMNRLRLLAQPSDPSFTRRRQSDQQRGPTSLRDVRWESPDPSNQRSSQKRILLAVGPDGGWELPYEIDLFRVHGFKDVSLPSCSAPLRTDIAIATLVTRTYELLDDEDAR